MTELANNELEGLYPKFVENGVNTVNMWSLTKHQLDEFKVPHPLLKKYLQNSHVTGKILLYLVIQSVPNNFFS